MAPCAGNLFVLFVLSVSFTWRQCFGIDMKGCESNNPYIVSADFNTTGDIYSPGFEDGLYPDELYCTYTIWATPGHKIKLTFEEFDLQPAEMCGKDRMYIFDGKDGEDTLIGVFCGSEPPNPLISPRNVVHILFKSDFLGGRKGFHIHYEASEDLTLCAKGYTQCKNRNCFAENEKCNGKDDCGDGTDEENCGLPVIGADCGINPIVPYDDEFLGVDRIIGGREVKPGSWPWQADLQLGYIYPNSHICGGTLIHPQWVLTAIHCVAGNPIADSWRIHIGNHHKYIKDDHEQVRYLERIIIYPGHTGDDIIGKSYSMEHDMALLKLSAPVDMNDYVKLACLPPDGYKLPLGSQCVATGWGTTRGSGSAEALKQVKMTTYSSCFSGFSNESVICVRNEKGFQDVCHGDSGGPLACQLNSKWTVMGVASFVTTSNFMGGLCGMPDSAAVFNRVSNKIKWIEEMMERYR